MSTTPTSRRGRPPLHRRETLLAAAARALSARGFESLRYSDVSDGAGVPVASLQHYFPNLEQLRREALSHGVRSALDSASAAVAAQRRPWGQVRALIAGTSDSATMWVEYLRAAARDTSLAEESRDVLATWVALAERDGFQATSLETLRHMVSAGVGITLLPELSVAPPVPASPDLALVRFESPAPYRDIAAFWRRTSVYGDLLPELVEVLRAAALPLRNAKEARGDRP